MRQGLLYECYITKVIPTAQQVDDTEKGNRINWLKLNSKTLFYIFSSIMYQILFDLYKFNKFISS